MIAGLAVIRLFRATGAPCGAAVRFFLAGKDASSVGRATAEAKAGGHEGEGEECFHVWSGVVCGFWDCCAGDQKWETNVLFPRKSAGKFHLGLLSVGGQKKTRKVRFRASRVNSITAEWISLP